MLCGGALNSPQLLMLSGIGPAAHCAQHGIEVRVDLPASAATCRTTSTSARCSAARSRHLRPDQRRRRSA
jgi:choline dehydrogenase